LQIAELIELVKQNNDEKKLQTIPYKIGDRILLIKTDNICYFTATDKYVEFHTSDSKKFLTDLSLKKLIERLPDNFIQIQRGLIVNTNFIKEFRKYFRGKYILVMDDVAGQNSTRSTFCHDVAKTIKRKRKRLCCLIGR
jgi:two-component system, LytTR family, response regulator